MLENTEQVTRLLREGRKADAAKAHAANVEREMARARAGETICLSDLMASKETLVIDALAEGGK